MRTILLLTLLTACNASEASKPDAGPPPLSCARPNARNFVCERVVEVQKKIAADKRATCEPEMCGEGDLHTHTARVTPAGGDAIVCGLNAGQLSMACGTLEVTPPQPKAEPAPSAPAPKAKSK